MNIYLHFMSLLHTDMTQVIEILPHVSQYLDFWYPGDARSQAIGNNGIYSVEPG